MRSFKLGGARVSEINLGDFHFRLKDEDDVPESEWRPKYSDPFDKVKPYPSKCFFIALPKLSVLVDAGDYSRFAELDPEHVIPNYKAPKILVEQLGDLGVSKEDVNYVVITHIHADHYAGVTTKGNSNISVPTFPKARYLLGKQDFENPDTQSALRDSNSVESSTIGVLLKNNLLELVEDKRELSDEVEIISAPGETPGHQIVRLSSRGQVLYCVGDLFHHAVEIEHVTWMAKWADPEKNLESKKRVIEAALKENALLAAAHMPLGKIEKHGTEVRFVEV